jgi:hypothetical protein
MRASSDSMGGDSIVEPNKRLPNQRRQGALAAVSAGGDNVLVTEDASVWHLKRDSYS